MFNRERNKVIQVESQNRILTQLQNRAPSLWKASLALVLFLFDKITD